MTTRLDLVIEAARATKHSQKTTAKVCTEFFNVLTTALIMGKAVRMKNAFVLKPYKRKAHPARNPRNGEPVTIPERISIRVSFPMNTRGKNKWRGGD